MDFLAELKLLQLETPRIGQIHLKNVNSEFTYNTDQCKNCYLMANAVGNEDCMYGRDFYGNTDCVDCDHIGSSTLCYECMNCKHCYNCNFCQDSNNSTDCAHCYNLQGCKNCVGCAGLRNSEYYVFNKQYKPDEYRKKVKELSRAEIEKEFLRIQLSVPRVYAVQINSENFTGNYVYHSENAYECFDVVECQDVGFCMETKNIKDSYDISVLESAEMCYEISSCHIMNNSNYCFFSVSLTDCEYSELLFNCAHCFGCISLQHKRYHILNKPYEKEEYFKQIKRLRAKPWYGKEFLPPTYPFEDTVAVWPCM